jgi:hypothetical protein
MIQKSGGEDLPKIPEGEIQFFKISAPHNWVNLANRRFTPNI